MRDRNAGVADETEVEDGSVEVVWDEVGVEKPCHDDERPTLTVCISPVRVSTFAVPPEFPVIPVVIGGDTMFKQSTVPLWVYRTLSGSSVPLIILAWKKDCTSWPAHCLYRLARTTQVTQTSMAGTKR